MKWLNDFTHSWGWIEIRLWILLGIIALLLAALFYQQRPMNAIDRHLKTHDQHLRANDLRIELLTMTPSLRQWHGKDRPPAPSPGEKA